MAESIRIEIPVSVQDSTDPALSNISGKLNKLASSAKKVSKLMNPTVRTSGLERTLSGVERKIDSVSNRKIDIGASDDATHTIAGVEDAASRISGMTATMEIAAADDATAQIADVEDAAAALNGNDANVELGADDAATNTINDVDDSVAALDGNDAVVDIGADDSATNVIADVEDALASLNGQGATIEINAEDNTGTAPGGSTGSGGGSGGLSVGGSMASSAAGSAISGGMGAITAAAGFAGLGLGVGSALQTFGDFESEMSHVKAISGATGEEFASLTDKAKELGATTKFTATESAQAFGYMAMAGWKPEQMEAGIDGVINLAAASGESIASVSDIVTDAMTAFGLSADKSTHFADVLAQSAASSNTNVGMLGESFKYIAPLAGAMGYSIEDVGIALGLMANAGVKGSMAGTSLRTAISNLAAPTDQMATAMEKYGLSLTDENGNMKSLAEVMENTRESLRGLSEDEQAAAVKTIFGKNAMSGMLAIINASDEDYQNLTRSINNADGAAERMADTMLDNMQGSLTLLSSQWNQVQTSFGTRLAPYVTAGANALKDALPGVEEKINEIFDGVDEKIFNMTNTKEWTEADFFGKVDIAWDTLIADPFREWADSSGASTIADIVGGLFSNALDVLPGGDEAQLTDWLSLGALVIAGEKIAGVAAKVYDLGQKVGSFSWGSLGTAGMVALGIAAAATAIWGVCTAIDAYNQKEVKSSLEAHFGTIELTEEQKQAIASEVLEIEWKANIDLALGELRNADTLRSSAEESLNKNAAIEYKAKVGVTLSQDDTETYASNVQSFIDARQEELDGRTFSAKLLVDTTLSTPEGKTLSSAIDSWTLEDNIEMSSLSSQLSTAVSDALADGIISADESQAISALQEKIDSIVNKWKAAENQASMDLLSDKYGNMSGEQLTGGAYKDLVSELQEQRQAANDTLDQSTEEFYTILHALDNEGRLAEAGLDIKTMQEQWRQAIQYEKNKEIANSLGFETRTLNNAYSEEIGAWNAAAPKEAQKSTAYLSESATYDENGKLSNADQINSMMDTLQGSYTNWSADAGLKDLYTQMVPDVTDMQGAIDEYIKAGSAVPQALMDSYNEAIQVGAAAGDADAGWQTFANSLVESGDTALIQAIQDGYAGNDTLRAALERSLAETTTEPVEVEGMKAQVEELTVTQESASAMRESINNFISGVEAGGSDVEYTADGVKVTLGEVDVDEPSAAEQLASAMGITMEELSGMTGVSEAELTAGATITFSPESITTDTTQLQSAIEESADGDTTNVETEADTTVTPGETDASEIPAAVEEEAQGAIDGDPPEADAEVDVNLSQTNNASEMSAEVQSDIDSAISSYSTSANVDVTLHWNITNPTASINVSAAGGTATATIASAAASANGRYVDGPLLSWIGEDGPEFVIPVGADKHSRGLDLWAQAGEALGVPGFADGYSPLPVSTSAAPVPVEIGGGTNNNNANVKFNPRINVNGMDGASLQAAMNKKMKEYADSMAGDIADMLAETYENRPVA